MATDFLCDLLAPDIWEAIKDDTAAKKELAHLAIAAALCSEEDDGRTLDYEAEFPALSKYLNWADLTA